MEHPEVILYMQDGARLITPLQHKIVLPMPGDKVFEPKRQPHRQSVRSVPILVHSRLPAVRRLLFTFLEKLDVCVCVRRFTNQ